MARNSAPHSAPSRNTRQTTTTTGSIPGTGSSGRAAQTKGKPSAARAAPCSRAWRSEPVRMGNDCMSAAHAIAKRSPAARTTMRGRMSECSGRSTSLRCCWHARRTGLRHRGLIHESVAYVPGLFRYRCP